MDHQIAEIELPNLVSAIELPQLARVEQINNEIEEEWLRERG